MFIVLCFKRAICLVFIWPLSSGVHLKLFTYPKQPQIGGRDETHNYINNDFPNNMC